MEYLRCSNSCEVLILEEKESEFIKNFKKALCSNSDRKLRKCIEKYLIPKSGKSIYSVKYNIEELKKLEGYERKVALAKAEQLKEVNDLSKFLPSYVAIIVSLIAVFLNINKYLALLEVFGIFFFLAITMAMIMRNRSAGIYLDHC